MTRPPANCVRPGAVSTEELIACARGEAEPAVEQHVNDCPSCQAQTQRYASLSAVLAARLFRLDCPPTLTIGEYAAGLLAGEQMREIAAHTVYCPHCRAESRAFSTFLAEPDELPEERGIRAAVRRIIASPILSPQVAFSGLRGAENDSMSFSAGDVQISLAIQGAGAGGGAVIIGLLLATSGQVQESSAVLLAGDQPVQTEPVDDLGNFLFSHVPAGSYRIELNLGATVIVLDSLEVA